MSGISYPTPTPTTPWPSFNSNQFTITSSSVSRNYVDSTFLKLAGGTMTGGLNAINLNLTGTLLTTGNVSMTNSGSTFVTSGTMSISRSGSHLTLVNGANSALIELPTSPNQLRLVRGYAVNISSTGVTVDSASNAVARYPIDLQASLGDIKLCLYQSGSNGTYGLGASSSVLNYCSGGAGHKFYKSSTSGVLSTLQAEIDTNSNFIASNNLIAGTGCFLRQGFSSAGRANTGLAMHMANSTYAEIFSYDYTGASFKDIKIANGLLCNGGTGYAGIGFAGGDIIAYPFAINTTISSSIPGSYGYLSTSGAGTGSGTGSVQVSLYCSGRAFAVEFDAYSDRRLKQNIVSIDSKKALDFIDKVEPVEYEWRNEDAGKRQGYIAQQLLATGLFPDICTQHVDPKMVADDESPEGYSLSLQYNNIIPILHSAIRSQRELLKQQQIAIDEMRSELKILKGRGKLKAISE